MSSAETKKPPVAPKPRLVIGHKIVPPPVAPKPEVVVVDVLQSSRKTKPVIAPKPKVLKCSTVPELKTAPTSIRRNLKTLEDHKKDSSEYLVHLNYKNGIPTDNAAYIISLCSCNFECIHKCGNGRIPTKNATIFEQLENLENINIDEQPSSSLKRGTIFESNNENNLNNYKVVLKANDLEEKLEDVMIQNVYPNNGHLRQKHLSKYQTVNAVNSNKNVKIEFSPPISNVEEFKESSSNDAKLTAVESEMLEVPLLTENNNNCFSLSNPAHMEKMDVNNTSVISCTKDSDKLSCGTNSVVSTKPFPVPKPRKLHTPCLVRQDGIDASGEDECDSSGIHEFAIKNTTKINVLVQSVSYKNQEHQSAVDKSEVASYSVRKVHSTSESTDAKELIPQSQLSEIAHKHCPFLENIGHSSDLNSIKPSINIMEDNSMLATDAEETGFVRCSNLSMSLPKQIKLSCNQTLPALVTLDDSAQKKEAKDVYLKGESSSRIIPKKPQRHGIAVAGLLKKSASEELLDTSAYFSSENKTLEAPLERPRIRHFSAREQNTVLLCDTPTSSSEKPIWKLPHPILPFSRNPETLKNTKNAKKVENFSTVTKPRAKSLSSVDMDRIHKPPKEPQKKSSLKKFLNMKWSVWMLKSDFQKFLAKGTQSTDNANGDIPSGEGPGKNGNAIAMANGRKAKPAKAHSAEIGSFFSQKGKQKTRAQNEIKINQRSKSLDEQTFSLQGHLTSVTQDNTHEYENVSHYEEIPEYENLPFAATDENIRFDRQNSSIVENQDTNMYEVEELYEPTGSCLEFGRSSAERDGSELMLEDIHSDDEIMPRDVNSSDEDEDDTNSDSSKGESDAQENKQFRASGKKTKVYHIAKEIMSSEKVFVDVLKLLHIDFRDSVAHASRQFGKPVIEDKVLNQILYYLPQLYELNRDLLRELEERLSHWIDHQRIADIFVKKGPYLKMYSTYIKEFDRNVALLDEHCKKNPGFAAVVREFEMSPRCANLALKHYLLKPVQRIPQYRLLLTDYLKNLLEDSADFKDTQDALAVVIEVANHANDIMKQGDNFQKLMQIQYSLTGHHEIVQPGRVFLKEGTLMKLSRKVMQPRMFFLFNDTLLYTTPLQSGMYKLNNMLSLAGMKVKKPTHEAYQNELNIESVERSFILSANSATERDEWLETISQSIEDYTKKRITFNPTKSLEEADQEKEEERPVGSKAPIWIPDTRATMCMICTSEFTLTWRRHHCRACGKIICQACSSNKHGLDYMKNHPARVCDHCFKELQKQDNMYTSKNGSPLNHRSPTNALSTVLHSIPSGRKQKKIPAALKEVSANTEDSSISGYLYRSKGAKKPWKHLWFVIKNKVLYTYAASEDVAALESQPLLGFTVAEVKDEHLESKVFHLLHKNTLFYIFRSDDSQSTQRWIEAFQEATIL
ncbi:LOW QUALITY PROTEIN: FYVE, RhoGEF and PH domain-containing protein 6 [Pantherophis guttatus]|uniref:LOW QUALITY PROTEIN: FYVE, RhoGEF and PH domain-containing protein 6 n=1 Tax=Pantherophis guttatus TaxID=94885 RepID=A0A6P9AL46_PANGU|nr:LOW QUALITY PROTEIN: FYVE, RhoGEF and PH domain-containing protein 6 [Pantherophis guttatus]